MLVEAFPRLAVRLRSTFPDALIKLVDSASAIRVVFPTFPAWEVSVSSIPCSDQFQIFESCITLRYDCIQNVPADDFNRYVSAENLGLRGASIIVDESGGKLSLKIRSTFVGQKGRTRDEAENLSIDVLSLLRFARMLEDRLLRSVGGEHFSYEMYYSQYLSKSIGRTRFINYARSVFQGSTERVFGQVIGMLKNDYKFKVMLGRGSVATVHPPSSDLEIIMRIPDEIPMLTCSAALCKCPWEYEKSFALVTRLNATMKSGHFELNADGTLISFVNWKHLTNDLRYYSLDQMISAVHEAEKTITVELPALKPTLNELLKARASSLDAYRAIA